MKLGVWVREIYDTRDLVGEVLDSKGNPRWSEWEGRFDQEDLNALEMALKWKDRDPSVEVTGLSVGHARKLDVLRECLYRGVDGVMRILPPEEVRGLLTEAKWVALASKKLELDVLFTGVQINELECGMKGVFLAKELGWPFVTYVEEMECLDGKILRVKRALEEGSEIIEVEVPVVLCVGIALLKDDPRAPRSARARLKLQHKKTPIPEWKGEGMEGGLEGFREKVTPRIYSLQPQRTFPSRRIDGSKESEIEGMLGELRSMGLVR